ncbi:modular serine protease-like [Danaus plexippus]|uniref:modular serine protease-like n=1 Tax=Danaus plexippus TaxID=13037 RepID=UPI002AB25CFE|nr:modular serine protease-like [Danaus plexippus]
MCFILKCAVILALYNATLALVRNRTNQSDSDLVRLKRGSDCDDSFNFRCSDGTCISADKKCDGVGDCPDGSDERFHMCRNVRCPYYHFRCTYGACVDGTASCNGVKECMDNSDELQPACQKKSNIFGEKFICKNGEMIDVYQICDGTTECSDNSDETLETCASTVCPSHLFQCAYGACVDAGAECNNLQECADNSDEWDLLCNKTSTTTTTTTETTETSRSSCVLPDHPKFGIYSLADGSKYVPRSVQENLVVLSLTCYPGYKSVGEMATYCHEGSWSTDLPYCARTCKLDKSPSIEYRCITNDEGTRACEDYEVEGTIVQPQCREPNYYSLSDLYYMVCRDGQWNYQPKCEAECGTLTPRATPLVLGGRTADVGEVPWHAGIYSKLTEPPIQICGASLVSDTVLVSAAHCFWFNENTEPAENYAVAVGKLHRDWDHHLDMDYQQTSDVQSIYVSHYYRGSSMNYQHDLAIVIVTQPFSYRPYIRPICVHFPHDATEMAIKNDDLGKVAGWGLTTVHTGSESPTLKVLDVPFVDFDTCLQNTPEYYREFFSSDKICGGYANGTSLCKGDSGGGYAFPFKLNGRTRYYLRGVVSTSPPLPLGLSCNIYTYTSFTDIMQHKRIIMTHMH